MWLIAIIISRPSAIVQFALLKAAIIQTHPCLQEGKGCQTMNWDMIVSIAEICSILRISRAVLYRYISLPDWLQGDYNKKTNNNWRGCE